MKNETRGDRLRKARKAMFESAAEAAQALGVKVSTYTSHENGTRAFDAEAAERYSKRLKVPAEWLLYGKGSGVVPGPDSDEQKTGKPYRSVSQRGNAIASGAANIREIDTRAGAGGAGMVGENNTLNGEIIVSEDAVRDEWSFPLSFISGELRINPKMAWMIEVYGDSGYDPANPGAPGSLFPGDRVIIDTGDVRPSPPGPFVVHDGIGLVIKLVDAIPHTDPPRVVLSSRNPSYPPREVTSEEARIIGRVRGRISAM